ncbi:non-structural transmembrane glycoprotein [Kimberley virus]|uniref:Non-structural transmembrane glycoprotein n=1 Tax=Kimberley virus TaxID=318835 RepID=J9U0Z2_9RHAB|nr:non-structural transmembrane glycoprotein [Kimberley virus]AFR67092.1 non-structural transmembrane glycoprotein [Kimberley virus]
MWTMKLIVLILDTALGIWVNHPFNCTELSDEAGFKYLCGDNSAINIRDEILDGKYAEIGEICTPDFRKSDKIQGYYCTIVKKSTECEVLSNLDNKIKYYTISYLMNKEACLEYVKHRGIESEHPFHPPPRCTPGILERQDREFIVVKETTMVGDPFIDDSIDVYLLNNITEGYKSIWHKSELCQVRNWKCHGQKNYIPLEIFKNDDQVSIRLELIKLGIIYDSHFGSIPIKGSCELRFCGKKVLRLPGGGIISVNWKPLYKEVPMCKSQELITNGVADLSLKGRRNIGGPLLLAINQRHENCKKIKNRILAKKPVPFQNLHYLNPFEPGKHIAIKYGKVMTVFSGPSRSKVVPSYHISYMECNYRVGDLIYDNNDTTNFTITFLGETNITSESLLGEKGWVKESEPEDRSENLTEGSRHFWYNGISRTDNKISYPRSFILQSLESIYNDIGIIAVSKKHGDIYNEKFNYPLEEAQILNINDSESKGTDNTNETEISLSDKKEVNKEQENKDESINEIGSHDQEITRSANETITVEDKGYWSEEMSVWGIGSLVSLISLYILFRRRLRLGKNVHKYRHRILRFFNLDYS